ncbi:hypothetical protein B0J11DRAFT_298462 [Dendryphion nanum]|uniref:Secreted protein n=1 Tax=Dendryphion nanum TaxID=256645 RepID=A0A9P9IN27_9PLEO|nr:hypothetical protein B0J11DRAFT_298462 [Dendryphion nanum]
MSRITIACTPLLALPCLALPCPAEPNGSSCGCILGDFWKHLALPLYDYYCASFLPTSLFAPVTLVCYELCYAVLRSACCYLSITTLLLQPSGL